MLSLQLKHMIRLNQSTLLLAQTPKRGFAIEDRTNKIECSTVYSEINCSGTYNDWEGFENYRKLVPFPKYQT